MPASATAATALPAGPQAAPPPQPGSQTGATMPPAVPTPSDASAPPIAPAGPPVTSNGLPWWVMALLEPGGAPLARAPLVTPDWASTYSLLGRIGQLQHPLDPDGPPVDMNMSLFPRPPGSDVRPPPQPMQFNITHPQLGIFPTADTQPPLPPRSVLFNDAPPRASTLP